MKEGEKAKYRTDFSDVLEFFLNDYDCNLDYLVDCYLFINRKILEENYYFIQNGYQYRYTKFEEVNTAIYANDIFMRKYMCGLHLGSYLWVNHYRILNYFDRNVGRLNKGQYLEIGVGFGMYLDRVSDRHIMDKYVICDVSKTSIDKCQKFLEFKGRDIDAEYLCQDGSK